MTSRPLTLRGGRVWVALCVALALALGGAACGDDGGSNGSSNNGGTSTNNATTATNNATTSTNNTSTSTNSSTTAADAGGDVEDDVDDGGVEEDTGPDVDPNDVGPPPEHVREEQPAAQGALRAGIGMGYFHGPVGNSMAGYGGRAGRNSPWNDALLASTGFYGLQSVKAMVLEVEGERLVVLKLPTMSSESSLTDGITEKLIERHGLDLRGRIFTGATHSHYTSARYWRLPPTLGVVGADTPDEEIIDMMSTVFADAIKAAVDDLAPAEWAHGYVEGWDPNDEIYRDRRGEYELGKDPRLSLLAVRRPDGTPMATVINFGMHGIVMEYMNDLFTEDAPGAVEMKFEDYFYAQTGTPILGMFIQSGGGDASPSGGQHDHPPAARNELIGEIAAPRIFELYNSLEWSGETTLAVRSRRIDLRYPWIYGDAPDVFLDTDGEPYFWGGWRCQGQNPDAPMRGQLKQCIPMDFLLETLGEPIPHPEIHQLYLSSARIGDLFLVTIPGEPAHSIVKYTREQVAERATQADQPYEVMVFGYSQDHLLYFTHPDDWYAGGYESEMSLWGPLVGQYVIDRQMQLVDDMIEGFNGPTFYEESPSLSEAKPYEPRPHERSLTAGDLLEDVPEQAQRAMRVRFAFGGGDPGLGAPHVVLQALDADGETFVDVPGLSGRADDLYDNRRYLMITRYDPDPSMNREILAERSHNWYIDWQVPEDHPAGTYRFRASGPWWDGTEAKTWEQTSRPFTITSAPGSQLAVTREGDTLSVTWTQDPQPYELQERSEWPLRGWRLLDHVNPAERTTVRAPIQLEILSDGAPVGEPQTVLFNAEAGAYTVDLSEAALPAGALDVRVHVAADRAPLYVQAPIP